VARKEHLAGSKMIKTNLGDHIDCDTFSVSISILIIKEQGLNVCHCSHTALS
jgi:hypothetical protein